LGRNEEPSGHKPWVKGGSVKAQRQTYLDWLRVLATLAVFLFHSLRMFDGDDWEVKNNVTSDDLIVLVGFFVQWLMPLFFIISGAAIYYSLRSRPLRTFLRERVRRILLPYLLVGIFVLIPPQEYIKLASHGAAMGESGLVALYGKYVAGLSLLGSGFPWLGLPMMHLWYLAYLFIFSLALLPVFRHLRSRTGETLTSRIASFKGGTWYLYLFSIPLGLVMAPLDPATPLGGIHNFGGWPLLVYPFFLLYGFVLFSDERFLAAMAKQAWVALAMAAITYVVLLAMFMKMMSGAGFPFGSPSYAGLMVLRAFNSMCWLIAIVGLARKHLLHDSRLLRYASEGSLAFYMLHQTVIVVIGYFIADWRMGILPKYLFLASASFVTIMVVYDLLIRRIGLVRFLFGMKPPVRS